MDFLLYFRLIGFTAGTLLQLFWMVVILGFRRQRNFERVFFFLNLALFLFYSGSLLALNAKIYYATPPLALQTFALTLICFSLCILPSLLLHLHLEYANTKQMLWARLNNYTTLVVLYLPGLYFGLRVYPALTSGAHLDFLEPGNTLGPPYGLWMGLAFTISGLFEVQFLKKAETKAERTFHGAVAVFLALATVLVIWLHVLRSPLSDEEIAIGSAVLAMLAVFPMGALVYLVHRYNFLQIGRQKNLVYSVSVTFLALLYLSLVRRLGTWLEPILPPEASAAILLFVLVIFFEPLQRILSRQLRLTAQNEMDRTQRLFAEIQNEARQGNLRALVEFIGRRVKEEFEFADAQLNLSESQPESAGGSGSPSVSKDVFWVRRASSFAGTLSVKPHGSFLSGETRAAIEFLCEQLPAALDLCQLIEEKLQLERELAERERLAALGQMAASISHNLKNPLGSMKTIMQLQLENPQLPETTRSETRMMLAELSRLSGKLNQLLRFSRPAVLGETKDPRCDSDEVVREAVEILRPEADRRGITLIQLPATSPASVDSDLAVATSRESLNDVVSNLLVNALDATSSGGHVKVQSAQDDSFGVITVEDDGPGIPSELREKILQPFFTTKSQGTGLGLAIVARRVAEAGGQLDWQSPVANSRGTRFRVRLPLAK